MDDYRYPGAKSTNAERAALLKGIAKLPATHSRLIMLHYLRDVPLAEAAKSLGIPRHQVGRVHFEALGRLKRLCQCETH